MKENVKHFLKTYNYFLVVLAVLLSVYGIIILGSVAYTRPEVYRQLPRQQMYLISGIILMLIASLIGYEFIAKFYIPIYIFGIILLILVFVIDNETNKGAGVDRWLTIMGFTIQPSEFEKLFLIIFLAKYIDNKNDKINNILIMLSVLIFTALPTLLVAMQPSLSASLVLVAICISMLFFSSLNYKYILSAFSVAVPIFAIFIHDLVSQRYKIFNFLIAKGILQGYHLERAIAFVGRDDKDDLFRQTAYSMYAIGSGGMNGKGLYNGTTNNLKLVDNAENDFVFSVIGEELGFIGATIAIVLIVLIIVTCLYIAFKADTNLGKLVAGGIASMFFFQTIVHICVNIGLFPNTGIPFPFLSSGGSSLWINMIAIGLVINIGMIKPKSMFEG